MLHGRTGFEYVKTTSNQRRNIKLDKQMLAIVICCILVYFKPGRIAGKFLSTFPEVFSIFKSSKTKRKAKIRKSVN
jgi:hypothetical protein